MQTLSQIKSMLAERGLAPRKSLGQNFLIDQNLVRKLVDAAEVGPGSLVLEIGPGTGTMTEELLDRGCSVIACELDRGLAALNRERLMPPARPGPGSLHLLEGDCMDGKRDLSSDVLQHISGRPFRLVSNLPYGSATPVILALLARHASCDLLAVTIQREVAERLGAAPGSEAFGTLSVVAQAMAHVQHVATLGPECFWPRPDVTSAMVVLRRRAQPLTANPVLLGEFCTRLFSQRRKQLGSVLGRDAALPEGVAPTQRAENLTIGQFIELAALHGPPSPG